MERHSTSLKFTGVLFSIAGILVLLVAVHLVAAFGPTILAFLFCAVALTNGLALIPIGVGVLLLLIGLPFAGIGIAVLFRSGQKDPGKRALLSPAQTAAFRYIKRARTLGQPDTAIRADLIRCGWSPEEASSYLAGDRAIV